MENLTVTTLAERPELRSALWEMPHSWPAFMDHDLVANALVGLIAEEFPEHVVVATDADGVLVARGHSVPFSFAKRQGRLPDRGWDEVLLWAVTDRRYGETPDTVSAIEIAVHPELQGRGLSGLMLGAMRDAARERGFAEVVAPVRPSGKHLEPEASMQEYAFRVREQGGLPYDPWLRVHVRAGATIEKVAPASMTISGSPAQWREWTGLPFDATGEVLVPGALAPVRCDLAGGYAVYVEPTVWVRHGL
ncbi:GNAT superfamily N-acetyltransferase [Kitasatospora gansuensis]|uniref:GNAT superfamily N-acetyltransferase n=1 Tax=Kitasatospora gansuensis TaxID=258050 RepID=A0A7W7S8Z0_9ACTN|nr:GNAT family N-acetyltransferase [Kitasatospora gansuensis]MBB4945667.1 GNAT superfamily N-acetyltransferase [Kitasatospora gansuensis]